MVKILGVDLGKAQTKTSEGVKFESKTKVGITKMNKDDIQVIYSDTAYTLGTDDGVLNIGKNRHKKLNYKLCLLTAIANSSNTSKTDCKVVVGVPVELFDNKELVESIKKEILTYKNESISINGANKIINIQDAEVFCESGIVFGDKKRFKGEKTLVIDLGGSTIDISLWDGLRLVNAKTYKEGMITLYENIIKSIKSKFDVELKPYESRNMIGKTEYIINQVNRNIEFINNDIDNYMTGLLSYINQCFIEVESCHSIQLIGGGAVALENHFKDEYKNAELHENAEFANANTFKEVGEMIWGQ